MITNKKLVAEFIHQSQNDLFNMNQSLSSSCFNQQPHNFQNMQMNFNQNPQGFMTHPVTIPFMQQSFDTNFTTSSSINNMIMQADKNVKMNLNYSEQQNNFSQ